MATLHIATNVLYTSLVTYDVQMARIIQNPVVKGFTAAFAKRTHRGLSRQKKKGEWGCVGLRLRHLLLLVLLDIHLQQRWDGQQLLRLHQRLLYLL